MQTWLRCHSTPDMVARCRTGWTSSLLPVTWAQHLEPVAAGRHEKRCHPPSQRRGRCDSFLLDCPLPCPSWPSHPVASISHVSKACERCECLTSMTPSGLRSQRLAKEEPEAYSNALICSQCATRWRAVHLVGMSDALWLFQRHPSCRMYCS